MIRSTAARFLAGSSLSHFARGVALIASAFFLLKQSGSVLTVGGLFVMVTVPEVLGSFFGGRLSDRWSRRSLAASADIVRSIAALVLAYFTLNGSWMLEAVYAFNLLLALGDALYIPAANALLAQITPVEELPAMNGRYEIATQLGNLLSVSIGGLLLDSFGFGSTLIMAGLAYFGSATFMASLPDDEISTSVSLTVAGRFNFAELLTELRDNHPLIKHGIMFGLIRVILTIVNTLLVTIIVKDLGQSATMLGITDAIAALGVIASGLSCKIMIRKLGCDFLMFFGFIGSALMIAAMPHFGLIGLMIVTGLMTCLFGWARVSARTELMRQVAAQKRGTYFGFFNAAAVGIAALSTAVVSAAAEAMGSGIGCGVGALVVSGIAIAAAFIGRNVVSSVIGGCTILPSVSTTALFGSKGHSVAAGMDDLMGDPRLTQHF